MKKRNDFELDPNFVPATPTATLTSITGSARIFARLYGDVTPDRLAQEQRSIDHRAVQLSVTPKREPRAEREVGRYADAGYRDEMPIRGGRR